jgi:hypothetical protein
MIKVKNPKSNFILYFLGAKNVRARVISEEFNIRESNYKKALERDEELHYLKKKKEEWLMKAAEEEYKKKVVERRSAEEILLCNIAKREAAELELAQLKNKNNQ